MRNKALFQKNLLAWYRRSHRPLPWRRTRDPYAIWISEILLQQTRVNAAIGYYERFMQRFPSLKNLADAPIEAVLQVWEGLGYYGRARNLHRAARILSEEYGERIPCEPEELERLPGIGPYTAAAIASIAFDRNVAVLDGNVTRVLCRAFGIREPPKKPSTQRQLMKIADTLLPNGHAADFNQAMMELGAMVCKPTGPDCSKCPIEELCVAHRKGIVDQLPLRSAKPKIPVRIRVITAIEHRGRLLLRKRPLEGFLGGLWEFPGVYLKGDEKEEQGLLRIQERVGPRLDVQRIPMGKDFSVKHVYSHFEERNRVYVCEGEGGANKGRGDGAEQTYRWIHPTRLDAYPITGATRKILRKLEQRKTEP